MPNLLQRKVGKELVLFNRAELTNYLITLYADLRSSEALLSFLYPFILSIPQGKRIN